MIISAQGLFRGYVFDLGLHQVTADQTFQHTSAAFLSVYYVCYRAGAFYRADGTRICGAAELPIQPEQADCVYDAKTGVRAWIWDFKGRWRFLSVTPICHPRQRSFSPIWSSSVPKMRGVKIDIL
jgi:hypothetical protein